MMDAPEIIKFERIISWDILFDEFMKIQTKKNKQGPNFHAAFPGVVASAIPCPVSKCALNYTFQPEPMIKHGGICGVDFLATVYNGEKTRIFLLPQLTEEAAEGPRGIVATSTGMVFDLSGGCRGCIISYPKVGMEMVVDKDKVRSVSVLVAGLHSHSVTYFHTVNELFPRLYLIIDYVRSRFNLDPNELLIQIRSSITLMNSINDMLGWGLTPTYRDYKKKMYVGSFTHSSFHEFMEGTERVIVAAELSKSWNSLISSARKCIIKCLLDYVPASDALECSAMDMPSEYILFIPREGERGRSLLNYTALQHYLGKGFDTPVLIPNLKYGCNLADNIRFFKNAVGFVSPHGAAFTNINFIEKPAVIVQIVPVQTNPFLSPITSLNSIGKKLGHSSFVVTAKSTQVRFNNPIYSSATACVTQ